MLHEAKTQTPHENRFCLLLGDTEVTAEASGEYTLPDYLPDIRKVLRVTAIPRVAGQYMNGEKAEIEGTADAVLLYMSEEGTVHAFHAEAPFAQSVPIPGMDETAVVTVRTGTDSSVCRLSGPRRFTMRHKIRSAVLSVGTRSSEPDQTAFSDAPQKLYVLRTPHAAGMVYGTETEEFRYSEDIPSADVTLQEILFCDVTATPSDTRASGGRITCKGEFRISVLCSAVSDAGAPVLRSLSARVPFTESLSAEGIPDAAKCIPDLSVTEVKCAVGDNGRICAVDFAAELSSLCMTENTVSFAEDAFSPGCTVRHEREEMTLLRPLKIVTSGFSAAGSVRSDPGDDVTEICDTHCRVSLDQHVVSGSSLTLSGQMECFCIGKTRDGNYLPLAGTVPVRWETDLPDAANGVSIADLSVSCVCRVLGCGCRPEGDGRSYSCDAELAVQLAVLKKEKRAVITSFSALPIPENEKEAVLPPPILLCYPQPGETVWEIARRYKVSPDALRARNGLPADGEPAADGHAPLFIPVSASASSTGK